jgi:hypothetical protein
MVVVCLQCLEIRFAEEDEIFIEAASMLGRVDKRNGSLLEIGFL